MNISELFKAIIDKESFLCIGLDTDIDKIPSHLLKEDDPVFSFNRQIIEATKEYCVSYKPNIAFYESKGILGWESLKKTMEFIPENLLTIADAKRGDIGNTSEMYARAFFDKKSSGFDFDAVTISPYMGRDSLDPFLEYENKWVILLALTSNISARDFQFMETSQGEPLYISIIKKARHWAAAEKLMFVVGATKVDHFVQIRQNAPDNFLLVPGIGAQGGSLELTAKYGMNKKCGILASASRSIIYASKGLDFAERARLEAKKIQEQMAILLDKYLKI